MIVGITGTPCAGKDVAANVLLDKGFRRYSTSDILYHQPEVVRAGGPTRSALTDAAERLNKELGNGALAKLAIKQIQDDKVEDAVVLGIRRESEVNVFESFSKHNDQNKWGFLFLGIRAPVELCFKWAQLRNEPRDRISFEEFNSETDREWWGINTTICLRKLFDYAATEGQVIENTGSIADLHKKVWDSVEMFKKTIV